MFHTPTWPVKDLVGVFKAVQFTTMLSGLEVSTHHDPIRSLLNFSMPKVLMGLFV